MLLTMIQSFLVPKQSFKSSGLYYPVQSDILNTTRSSPSLSFFHHYEVIKIKVESGSGQRKRKSRWADNEPKPLPTSLPIQLPDFMKELIDVRDCLVPQSLAPILESLFNEYGDVGAETNLSSRVKDESAGFLGFFFSETSALSGDNVDTAFFRLLEEIYGVISKKNLECVNGKSNGGDAQALKGSKIDVISGAELEISEMKKLSACSC
ncbi:ras-related protein raba3 [Quercus suber]|uniref:Ras-related protein raba3 n=1 Tax=Quercus suber TaxID=58331 RepID=A0AAW0JJV9_QUESU